MTTSMIEFNGYLTGYALKYFSKRYTRFLQVFMAIPSLMGFPVLAFLLGDKTKPWVSFIVFLLFAVSCIFVPHLIVKFNIMADLPKQIFIKNNIIVCVSKETTVSKKIEKVKRVEDYGEFYSLTFPVLGSYSPNFVCQKNLLTKGTLEEFEALFEEKIVRK